MYPLPAMTVLIWLLCSITLSACSTLPQRQPVIASFTQQIDTSQTRLALTFAQATEKNYNKTGYYILYNPAEALISRLQLIERAEKTLDLQYYIWDNDNMGALALAALLKAADRGVQIRLLIDDNNSKGLEAAYYALDQHPNIQIRLFNPYKFRRLRALDLMLDFNRLTRRMHNKTFIADHTIALVGGRNMSNQYFNASDNYQFSDMDVVLAGQAVKDINTAFDEYWNHEYAYPVNQTSAYKANRLSFASVQQQLQEHWFNNYVRDELGILTSSLKFDSWFNQDLKFNWVSAKVIVDPADKVKKETNPEDSFLFHLTHLIDLPQNNMDLVSAYFVPTEDGVKALIKDRQNGVKIRILTNSFKANDVPIVHAFYAKYREELLKNDIELYEFLPVLPMTLNQKQRKEILGIESKFNRSGLSRSSLHSKFMAFDEKQVFIGSFNLDPRSSYLNTEIGVILDSPELAQEIHTTLNQDIMRYAYRVELNENDQLQWIKLENNQEIVLPKEPQTSWWQRIGIKMMSWLPLEKQM